MIGHGAPKKPWSITKMRDYFMAIKSTQPQMTPDAETIIKTYVKQTDHFNFIIVYLDTTQCLVESPKILVDISLFVS